jgi:hypothetical protein
MVENDLVVDSKTLDYKGYFDHKELLTLIDQHIRNNGYVKRDTKHNEEVKPHGRRITIMKEPYKRMREYAMIVLAIDIEFDDIKQVAIERGGQKKKLEEGKVHIDMRGFLQMDWENRWEGKAVMYFLATLYDRFVHKWQTDKIKVKIPGDIHSLYLDIQEFLAMYKY